MKDYRNDWQFLAHPGRFIRLSRKLFPFMAMLAMATLIYGLYLSLYASPPDYQQGHSVRIMYIHVPSAYLSMAGYLAVALASASYLIWHHPLGDMMARAILPIGALFTLICLITGALWGKPMWGAYWVWDARLTSMLILFCLYMGIMALRHSFEDERKARRPCAILSIIGVINLPIIKFSVDWWHSLHQPASLITLDGPKIDISMLHPLLVMILAFSLLFACLFMIRMELLMIAQKIRQQETRLAKKGLNNG